MHGRRPTRNSLLLSEWLARHARTKIHLQIWLEYSLEKLFRNDGDDNDGLIDTVLTL